MTLRKRVSAALKALRQEQTEIPEGLLEKMQERISRMVIQAATSTWFEKGQEPPWVTQRRLTDIYKQDSTVHRSVKVTKDVLQSIPAELFREGADTIMPKGLVRDRWENPNARQSNKQLQGRICMDLMLFGNAVILMDGMSRIGAGAPMFPESLIPLAMRHTKPEVVKGDWRGWRFTHPRTGRQVVYSRDETIHFLLEDPNDPEFGVAEVSAVRLDADTTHIANLANHTLLKRGGPSYILKRSDPNLAALAGEGEEEALEEEMDKGYQDEDDHASLILPAGVDIAKLGGLQREMDFEKLLRYAQEAKAGTLGVPPSVTGILQFANYANMGAQMQYLFHFTIFPMCDLIESVWNTQLFRRLEVPARVFFQKEMVRALFQDQDRLSQISRRYWEMGYTLEQINERLDLGFDTDDLGEVAKTSFLTVGVEPAERVLADPVAQPITPDEIDGTPPPDSDEEPEEEPETEAQAVSRKPSWPREEVGRMVLWQKFEKTLDSLERRYLGDYRQFLVWLAAESIKRLKAHEAENVVYLRQTAGDELIPAPEDVDKQAVETTRKATMAAMRKGNDSVNSEVGGQHPFQLTDSRVFAILNARERAIKGASQNAAKRVRETLVEGIKDGETVPELTERVRKVVNEERVGHAASVARTETAAAFSMMRHVTMGELGIKRHQWLSARDTRVRPTHTQASGQDGEVVEIGTPFRNGLIHPLDPGGPAHEVVNCRCVALPVVA